MIKEIHIITIFPDMFETPFNYSMVKRAQTKDILKIQIHDLRQWTDTVYQSVDDHPFGGGPGMIFKVEPLYKAITAIKKQLQDKGTTLTILTSAKGQQLTQKHVRELTGIDNLIIICGHYEGIDERISEHLVDEEISIGKYVLSGGELPAMIITDAIARLLPGVVGNQDSIIDESFSEEDVLEYPQYTRPAEFLTDTGDKWAVPSVLLNGNHKEIAQWRQQNKKKIS